MNKLILSYIFTSASVWVFSFLMPLLFLSAKASPLLITVAYAVSLSPYLIVTPIAGALCDRFNKKYMMLFGELLAALSIATIVMMPMNDATIPFILLLTFIAASAGVMHHPTFQSIIPSVIHQDSREKFNATINGVDNIVNIFSPLGAGSLLMLLNHQQVLVLCIALNCVSFLIIACLNYQHRSDHRTQEKKNIVLSILDGFRYVARQPVLRSACIMFFAANFGITLFVANVPYIFIHNLGASEGTLSICFAVLGAGALLGSFCSVKLMTRFRYGSIIVCSTFLQGLCYLINACFDTYYMIAGVMFFTYGMSASTIVSFFTLRQKIAPASLLGRVTATTRMLVYTAIPLAAMTGGYFLNCGGHHKQLLIIGGALMVASAFYGRKSALFGAG